MIEKDLTEQKAADQEGQPDQPVRRRTIEQKRAEHAANAVSSVGEDQTEAYAKFVRKVPSMLTTQGLGQTVAYLRSKAGDAENRTDDGFVLKHLREWMTSEACPIVWDSSSCDDCENPNQAFQCLIAHSDNATYYRALGEAIAYVGWLKRLSQAHDLEVKATAKQSGSTKPAQAQEQRAPSETKASINAG